MSDTNYYFAHGEAWLGERTSGGDVDNFDIPLPEIDSLTLSFETEKIMHRSKRSSVASNDLSRVIFMGGNGTLRCSTHTANLLKLYLYGEDTAIAGGSFSNAAFPSGIVAGDVMPLPGGRCAVSSLVLTDSAGSPTTLVLGTHYTVDLDAGVVTFISVSGVTQPFKAAGTETAAIGVGMLQQRVFEKYLRFKGINVADGDKKCLVDIYKIQPEPAANWNLMGEGNEVNTYEIPFTMLKDTTKAVDATFGQYGVYREVTA